mgnify:CR=1 FL=1
MGGRGAYETLVGEHHPGVITGKPIPLGGSEGRGDATARGGVYVTREAAKTLGIDLGGKTMAIQGFGNAGQYAALLGHDILGLTLVAASDSKGGIHNPRGLDPRKVVDYKRKTGSLQGFPGADPISNEALLELEVTVLFPSALENVITPANANRLQCKISCELANGPTTPEADDILYDRGIFVVPDFLANAGGVTVSYFEQVQNTYNFYWPLSEVHQRLDEKVTRAFHGVHQMYNNIWETNVALGVLDGVAEGDGVADGVLLGVWDGVEEGVELAPPPTGPIAPPSLLITSSSRYRVVPKALGGSMAPRVTSMSVSVCRL